MQCNQKFLLLSTVIAIRSGDVHMKFTALNTVRFSFFSNYCTANNLTPVTPSMLASIARRTSIPRAFTNAVRQMGAAPITDEGKM
jgi:hypothetical protein